MPWVVKVGLPLPYKPPTRFSVPDRTCLRSAAAPPVLSWPVTPADCPAYHCALAVGSVGSCEHASRLLSAAYIHQDMVPVSPSP